MKRNMASGKGYGIVHWRFIDLINLQFELLFYPANQSNVLDQIYHKLISFIIVHKNIEILFFQSRNTFRSLLQYLTT